MRLTCPNCKAQYEVEESVVPPEGRDVQCSSCGTTWFQYPASVALDMRAHDLDDDDDGDAAPTSRVRPAEGTAPRIDRTVLDVLRQEAEREIGERRRSRPDMGTQAEMGLAARPRPRSGREGGTAPGATRGGAGTTGGAPQGPSRGGPQGPSRGGLLPDIDELSTTLAPRQSARSQSTPDSQPVPDESADEAAPRRDFLRGLITIMTIAAVLTGLYLAAPWLAEQVPALSGALAGYVALVDSLRSSLSGLLGG